MFNTAYLACSVRIYVMLIRSLLKVHNRNNPYCLNVSLSAYRCRSRYEADLDVSVISFFSKFNGIDVINIITKLGII